MLAFKPHWCQISAVLRNGRFKHVLKSFLDSWPGMEVAGQGGCKLWAWVLLAWSQPQRSRAETAQSQLRVLMSNCKQFPSRPGKLNRGLVYFTLLISSPEGKQPGLGFSLVAAWANDAKEQGLVCAVLAQAVIVSGYYSLTRNVNEVP